MLFWKVAVTLQLHILSLQNIQRDSLRKVKDGLSGCGNNTQFFYHMDLCSFYANLLGSAWSEQPVAVECQTDTEFFLMEYLQQ